MNREREVFGPNYNAFVDRFAEVLMRISGETIVFFECDQDLSITSDLKQWIVRFVRECPDVPLHLGYGSEVSKCP